MPLSRLLPLLAALLVLATAVGVGRSATSEWQADQRAAASLRAVEQLRLALGAAEAVSKERGPSNAVLCTPAPLPATRVQALMDARDRTDRAFEALRAVLAAAGETNALRLDIARRFDATRQALAVARGAVDRTLAPATSESCTGSIRQVVRGMVELVPMIAPVVGMLADDAQQAYPALSDDVQSARLTAELREVAGLLGSQFTAALARQQPFTHEERNDIQHTRGRIDELRLLIELRLRLPGQDPGVMQAWQLAQEHYFERAGHLLSRVIASGDGDGHFGMDAAGFAAQYVPDMNTLLALRDALLTRASARAAAEHERCRRALLVAGMGSALQLLLLAGFVVQIHRRVLKPLALTAHALKALARRERDAPMPLRPADDEMAAVIAAVRTLQYQTTQRTALERERDDLIEQLREQSNTDFLTGLPNRRAFFAAADRQLSQAERHGFGVVAVLLDIDHFKRLNDCWGHATGDQALAEVANTVRQALRKGDLVARFGGEEFVLLLSHSDLERGLQFAERLRASIERSPVACPTGEVAYVSASLGVADSQHHGLNLEVLLAQADAAMYLAKQQGRNRVVMAPVRPDRPTLAMVSLASPL